ncbi:Signal transduction histidine kinase [Fodinibius sediminis]|uniref:histidine kinase n=1 Tax=Fodinibius sediminis TaxID=1214077 RepID=A0A521FEY6_9BACT|nr:Signal transduction histidine kinase [Fodinibius sediminis]
MSNKKAKPVWDRSSFGYSVANQHSTGSPETTSLKSTLANKQQGAAPTNLLTTYMNVPSARSKAIYGLLILSVLLLGVTAASVYLADSNQANDRRQLLQSHRIIHHGGQILLELREAQLARLRPGGAEDPRPGWGNLAAAQSHLDSLAHAINQHPDSAFSEQTLRPKISRDLASLEQYFRRASPQGRTAPEGPEEELIAGISQAIGALRDGEEAKLAAHRAELQQGLQLSKGALYFGLFFVGVTILLALRSIIRKHNENKTLIDQLEQSHEDIKRLHARELELSQEKSKFMDLASHDLRNPLTVLTYVASEMKDERTSIPAQHREKINFIDQSVEQMKGVINRFLDTDKIEVEGAPQLAAEPTNMVSLIEALISGFKAKATDKGIALVFDPACQGACFYTDRTRVSQIATNLISNALKYSTPESTVRVRLESQAPGQVTLIVADEGLGMEEAELKELYKPYANISTRPTGDEDSTGLGLFIVKNSTEALGGTITCQSEVGVGTTFTVRIPELDGPEGEKAGQETPSAPTQALHS